MKKYLSLVILVVCPLLISAQNRQSTLQQDGVNNPNAGLFPAHDPVMIKQDSLFYLFTTGGGSASSPDMKTWKRGPRVFEKTPEWITPEMIPGFRGGGYWAPDIQYVNGTYYLFYSFSAFGKNTSVTGVATNKTLHPEDPDFKWIDHGPVVQSVPNRDFWNAIDANLIIDGEQGWLAFGSFWGGIKMVKLAPDLLIQKLSLERWLSKTNGPVIMIMKNLILHRP